MTDDGASDHRVGIGRWTAIAGFVATDALLVDAFDKGKVFGFQPSDVPPAASLSG